MLLPGSPRLRTPCHLKATQIIAKNLSFVLRLINQNGVTIKRAKCRKADLPLFFEVFEGVQLCLGRSPSLKMGDFSKSSPS